MNVCMPLLGLIASISTWLLAGLTVVVGVPILFALGIWLMPIRFVRGVVWLERSTKQGKQLPPSPVGFYFAKLWYYEKLYPIIYPVAALECTAASLELNRDVDLPEDGAV